MPKVTLKREGGLTIEADLSLDEIKELWGVNGHKRNSAVVAVAPISSQPNQQIPSDYATFYRELNDTARKFFSILMLNNNGISADELAPKLGFNNANQIGGLTGGGVAKIAKKHGIPMSDLYHSEKIDLHGAEVRVFFPGRLILQQQQKTA